MPGTAKKMTTGRRIIRIVLKTFLWIFLLIVVLFLLVLTPPAQRFITNKATRYLEKKLETRVSIDRLFITLSGKIAIDGFYLEDRQKDTLLSAGKLRVDMSFAKLIFGKAKLDIRSVLLEDATAKIKRQLPDTTFNFQFIIDAFGSGSSDSIQVSDTSAAMPISIGTVELNRLRFVYKDIVSGNDVESGFAHFDTKVEEFDLDKLRFGVPRINMRGLTARIIQTTPLVIIPPDEIQEAKVEHAASDEPILQMDIGRISLEDSYVDYRDSVGAMYALLQASNLDVQPRKIDLATNSFDLGDILLEKTGATLVMGKKREAPSLKKTEKDTTASGDWGIRLASSSLTLKEVALKYDDENKPPQREGMDYFHLNANIPAFELKNFLMSGDSIAGQLARATLSEQSGFRLEELRTDFLYSGREAYLKDIYLKTPGSELKREAAIRYASLDAMASDIGNMQVQAVIIQARIKVKDVLTFVPSLKEQPLFADPNAVLLLDGKINGRVSAMKIDRLAISALNATKIDLNGSIHGLPDVNRVNADLHIRQVSSTRRDLMALLPKNALPDSITFPERMNLAGRIKGGMNNLFTDLQLKTDLGDVSLNGTMQQITDAQRAGYDMHLLVNSVDVGTILQDSTYGPVTLELTAKGRGYDPKTAEGTLNGIVQSAVYRNYTYRDFRLNAAIADHQLTTDVAIEDPNIDFTLTASANMATSFPTNVKLDMKIDSIKAGELHLTDSVLNYHGKINADFASVHPDSLDGRLFITESVLLRGKQRIVMDSIHLLAGDSSGKQFMEFKSDIAYAKLAGRYRLTQLGDVLLQAIQPYYAVGGPDRVLVETDPYDFTLNASITDRPVLRGLVPGIGELNGVVINSRFSSSEGVTGNIKADEISYSGTRIKGLLITAATEDSVLRLNAGIGDLRSGSSIHLDSTILNATVKNNTVDAGIFVKDGDNKTKFSIGTTLQQLPSGDLVLSLHPDDLVLKYDKWNVAQGNRLTLGAQGGINASNFTISKSGQELSINSASGAMDAPIHVALKDFRLSTVTSLVMSDSTMIDGIAIGNVTLRDITTTPAFTGDHTVNDFSFRHDTVGNIHVKGSSGAAGVYNATVTLQGRGNDAVIDGSYNTTNSTFQADIDLRRLPLTVVQAFSGGMLRNSKGYAAGNLKASGSFSQPSVTGELNFHGAGFNVSMFNNYFGIDNEKLVFTPEGIRFDKFAIKDSTGNPLTLDGMVATKNFQQYHFNLSLDANNFRVLNSTKKDNKLFYGQLYINTDLQISGTESAPAIDGRLTVNEKTKMTVVLPQSDPGIVERQGVVEFVNFDAPDADSLFMQAFADSLNKTTVFEGMHVSVNIGVNKAADFTLIIDEANGDFLNLRGAAQINAGVEPGGAINMVGNYEVEQGTYELSFNMLKRKFNIEKGSRITWQGEPTDATVDITAKYSTKAAPYDLVKGIVGGEDQSTKNTYLQKIPIDVLLKMNGQLMKPQISFDIVLPDNRNLGVSADVVQTTRTQLETLRQQPNELNKQVFALMLLNRFVAEDPFASSAPGSSATDMIKQSVSALMAEQLNRLAEGLIEGVDINFGIESTDDYTSGEKQSRTDVTVGISKRLLNDRLTVTVGSDITVDGPQATNNQSMIGGNVAVDYALSEDGRYKLRAYCINDYEGVIDGYVVETGVGFIITVDYNRFQQIFQNRKKRRAAQQQRREEQQQEERSAADPNKKENDKTDKQQ